MLVVLLMVTVTIGVLMWNRTDCSSGPCRTVLHRCKDAILREETFHLDPKLAALLMKSKAGVGMFME